MYQLINRSREHLRSWLPWVDGVTSEDDVKAFINISLDQVESGRGAHYALFHQGKMAGVTGFHPIDWPNRNAEIGYWLGEEFLGKGIVTRAAGILLHEGFCELGLNRIEIRCATENVRSRAVAKRLGMFYEGTLREEEWLYNRYVDHAVYSILKREYSCSPESSTHSET
jgi:ribosomal-protein-serine acetyltransferase